jgi:predicted transcriptional regulator
MAATASLIRISTETEKALGEASHFLQRSTVDILDEAVVAYIEAQRSDVNAEIRDGLARSAS